MKTRVVAIAAICAALAASAAPAQVQQGLEYSITPYLWASGLDGTSQVGPVTAQVDTSFSDLLDVLEFAVPIHFEASGPVWTLIAEVNFNALSQDLEGPLGGTGELEIDMLLAELLSGYELGKFTELLFGARYVSLESTLRFDPVGPAPAVRAVDDQDWVDPVVGLRYGGPMSRRWNFMLRGDLGGFGVGSDLTWNLRGGFGVELSEVTQLLFGYHAMDTDYDDNGFVYDMLQYGPEVAISFKW